MPEITAAEARQLLNSTPVDLSGVTPRHQLTRARNAWKKLRALAQEAIDSRDQIAQLTRDLDAALEYGQRLQRRIVTQESSSGQPAPTADPTEWTDIGENMAVVQHINRETLGLRFGVPGAPFYVITHLLAPLVRRLQAFLNENWPVEQPGKMTNLYRWRPIAEIHEDYGPCVLMRIGDPGALEIGNNLDHDFEDGEWTHFAQVPKLTNDEAEELRAAMQDGGKP